MKRKKIAETPAVPVLGYRYKNGKLYCEGLFNAADPEDAKILRKLDPEVAELREEAQRQKVAGLGPGVLALVRQAPPAPGADPGPWEVLPAPETMEED